MAKKKRKKPSRRMKAWTGGSSPRPLNKISKAERKLVDKLYREQVKTFTDYWGDKPDRDTRGIFKSRARYDAHATFRKPGKRKLRRKNK